MKTVVICGKGGIGKSTIVTGIAVLLQRAGQQVLQIGCDPKHDSCLHHLERDTPPVMEVFRERGSIDSQAIKELVAEGRTGVHCMEIGGPQPGVGCAGRAISLVLEFMNESPDFFHQYDIRFFDLVGDVVCGGFAAPIRTGQDTEIYLVVSGELLPLYAANNIARGVVNLARRGGGRIAGVIANQRNTPSERQLISFFAEAIGTRVVGWIPRDQKIFEAELAKRSVVEMFPDSPASQALAELAQAISTRGSRDLVVPKPLSDEDLQAKCYRGLNNP